MPMAFAFAALAFLIAYLLGGVATWKLLDALNFFRVGGDLSFLKFVWVLAKSPKGTLAASDVAFSVRFYLPMLPAILAGAGLGWLTYRAESVKAELGEEGRLVRGRTYIKNNKTAARLLAQELPAKPDGLSVHPTLPRLSTDKETEHWFVIGGVGSGKTTLLLPWITAARARGDRVLLHDIKGDFTSLLPNSDDITLIAPWDKRSSVWNIAEDIPNRAAAIEFAARLIPESKGSPMWSNAARQVLVAIIVFLQKTKTGTWGFADLAEQAAQPLPELLKIAQEHHPEAIRALEGQNVTTAGIIINMAAFMAPVYSLASAWPVPPKPGSGFSVRRWLTGKSKSKTVILQGSGQYQQLARGINAAIVGLAAQVVNSPALSESTSRRVWFMLDEFPQLGEAGEPVGQLIEVGRSKGIRVVLTAQSLDQLKAIYDKAAAGWLAMVGTVIVGRTQGETARFVSTNLIGDQEIERLQVSETPGGQAGGLFRSGVSRTITKNKITQPALMPSELSNLGKNKAGTGVELIWLTPNYALRVLVPFVKKTNYRAPSCLAGWTYHPLKSPEEIARDIEARNAVYESQQPQQPAQNSSSAEGEGEPSGEAVEVEKEEEQWQVVQPVAPVIQPVQQTELKQTAVAENLSELGKEVGKEIAEEGTGEILKSAGIEMADVGERISEALPGIPGAEILHALDALVATSELVATQKTTDVKVVLTTGDVDLTEEEDELLSAWE